MDNDSAVKSSGLATRAARRREHTVTPQSGDGRAGRPRRPGPARTRCWRRVCPLTAGPARVAGQAALGRGDTFWGDGTVQYPDHSDGFTAHTDVRILHVVQFKYVLFTVNELHVNVAEKKTLTRHTL